MSPMKQAKPLPFWKRNASQTNSSTKSSYLTPQRSASALAGRHVDSDTQEPRSFPSLGSLSESRNETKRLPPEPPPKPDHYRAYSFSQYSSPVYNERQIEKHIPGSWNATHEADRGLPERKDLKDSVDTAGTKKSGLGAASLRLSGRTMREDTDSIMEQGVGNMPSEGSDDASVETILQPLVKDDGLRGPKNERSEKGSRSEPTEANGEERNFSERLYQKFLQHFPQVNGTSADQQADRSKALWLIAEANQESRSLCLRLDREIAQAESELRKQKKRHKVEMSTQDQWTNTLKQSESELKAKLAAVERDLEKRVATVQGEMRPELAEKDRQLKDLNRRVDAAMHEKESNFRQYQSHIEKLKADLARRTEDISKAKKEIEAAEIKLDEKARNQDQMREELHEEMQVLKQKHAHEMQELEAYLSSNMQDLARARDENVSRMREAHEAQLSRITANATQVKKEQEEAHQAALSESNQKHEEQTSLLVEAHSKELRDMSRNHQAEMASSVQSLEASREKMARKASHNAKNLAQLEAEYSQSTADTLRSHEADKAKLEQAAACATDEALQRLEKLRADHEDQMNELKKSIGTSKVDLVQRQKAREEKLTWIHQQQMQQVQEEVRDFNEALLTRDEDDYQSQLFSTSCLPRKTDEEICHQFEYLRSKVDTLSGFEWRRVQQCWTAELFQRIGERAPEPQLRKAVVQDIIWTQLYHFVFSSPFRIFGSEGKTLEDEWNKERSRGASENGSQFNWPEASVRAELWRAFTVKGCRDVLRQQLSPLDQRASLKRGFKETLDSLIAALKEELDSIVELPETEPDLIPKLCKQAATIWLQFAMCQSRIVISLTGEDVKSTAEKVAQVQKGSLALTRLPRISRYGTVLGVELSKCTVVAGCDGDCRNIP